MIRRNNLSLYGLIALLHGALLWICQIPFPDPSRITKTRTTTPVLIAAGTRWDKIILNHPMVGDPLLVAQSNERGFTGDLWNKSFKSPNSYIEWSESPRYLKSSTSQWGKTLAAYLDEVSRNKWRPLSKPRAQLTHQRVIPTGHQKGLQISFSPNLADRQPQSIPELPLWEGSTLLPPTRLQIGINPLGFVQSVRLLDPPAADPLQSRYIQETISGVKNMRFQRIQKANKPNPDRLQWGEIEFKWPETLRDRRLEKTPQKGEEVR
ncbi:MAG: hypothetical protein P8L18_05855 [Verrucomicrobiota bacterium]|nr:hypothetical protein [Verrucomicrobiota bacterium]